MNKLFNELKTEMKTYEKKLQNIAHSIPTENMSQHEDAMRKLAALNHAYIILESETTKENKPRKPQHRISTAVVNGVEHQVSGRKAAIHTVCQSLVKNNYKDLKANNDKFVSAVTGDHFASIKKDDLKCDDPIAIKHGKKQFYYDSQRMLTNNGMLFNKMLNIMNVPEGYVQMS
jgi:hypothetical protein